MSSGAGHILDMMNRIRQNAALKISRRNKFKGGNTYSSKSNKKPEYDFPEVSDAELELMKANIRKEAEREHKKQRFIWVFFVFIVTIIFILFNYLS